MYNCNPRQRCFALKELISEVKEYGYLERLRHGVSLPSTVLGRTLAG